LLAVLAAVVLLLTSVAKAELAQISLTPEEAQWREEHPKVRLD
jgi:hypothetical protein